MSIRTGSISPEAQAKRAKIERSKRAKRAKLFINHSLPALLKSNARARRGVAAVELIADPPAVVETPQKKRGDVAAQEAEEGSDASERASAEPESEPLHITIRSVDTLEAASELVSPDDNSTHHSKRPPPHSRVAVLNMASPLRPGGGVLSGATSQEEWLCARTTLYASLHEEFYRLPEVGAIYTPDVLVCRRWDFEATEMPPQERFFIDVVTAAMLRFPDLRRRDEDSGGEEVYEEEKDRELALAKMRAVMRILRAKGVTKVVLGAWGCGAYSNPVGEVARAWRTVLRGKGTTGHGGGDGARRKKSGRPVESWDGMEVVFAIKGGVMADVFAEVFGLDVEP